MFFKRCPRCNRRISKNSNYCAFCGHDLRKRIMHEDFGLSEMRMPFPFNKLFDQLTKELARELDKTMEFDDSDIRKEGISISISNVDGVPRVKVGKVGMPKNIERKKQAKRIVRKVSKEDAERYSKLPRKEAETNVKRLSDGIIYEISMPDVSDIKDIFINKLHNSIEVKAFGKDTAYLKLIPVDLDIKRSYFKDGKLILELKE